MNNRKKRAMKSKTKKLKIHEVTREGNMHFTLFESFTPASNPDTFHLHPFGDSFFAGDLRLTDLNHYKKVLAFGQV